jgi:putative ABC transport system ATP-binding protein
MGGSVPVLELRGVTKRYPGSPPVEALRNVSVAIHPGELLGIVGPSGSGKSTLLHLAGTLDTASDGSVQVEGVVVDSLSDAEVSALRAQRIGFLFQQFHLLPGLTALENVALGLTYLGIPAGERHDMAAEALARVGMSHRSHHRPGQLSGGEQQRTAIARAIVHQPAFILADEPTGNLDTRTGAEILALLGEFHAAGATMAVITHDMSVAASLPRRIELRDGEIVHDSALDR